MPHPNPDDSLLLIRCPSCGQRFKVGEDLRERTVECGGCEHRFRIDDEVIVRGRKFYPGERSAPALNRFQRVPLSGGESLIGAQPIRYGNMPDPAVIEPVSPQRIMAGAVGVAGIVLMALFLMFGGASGGLLDGMGTSNRLVMAGFASLLGVFLLYYANPKARFKALAVGLSLSAGLMAVPFFFKTGSAPLPTRGDSISGGTVNLKKEEATDVVDSSITALRSRIGTGPLVSEMEKYSLSGSGKRAVGMWLRDLNERNKHLVRDYIVRVAEADSTTHLYPRDGGDYLLVVTGTGKSLQELAELSAPLGQAKEIYPEISVVEVVVNNENFIEGTMEKLSNKEDPAFYDLNKRELESIELGRVKRAVQRLADAEPKIYRTDITRKLIGLLGEEGVDFKGAVCKALAVWSERPGPASAAALKEVRRLLAANQPVPPEIVSLIVLEKNAEIVPILDELWYKNPMTWESLYGDLGQPIESTVIKRFGETTGSVRYSAIRLLGRTGGADSLPVLASAGGGSDPELKVLLEQARRSITGRLGQ